MSLHAFVSGHVGQVKHVKTDKFSVLNFSVASNSVTSKGEPVTNWVAAKVWGPRGEKLAEHLVPGQGVVLLGRPESRGFTAKDGTAKAELVVHVDKFEFSGKKPEGAPAVVEGDPAPTEADDNDWPVELD